MPTSLDVSDILFDGCLPMTTNIISVIS